MELENSVVLVTGGAKGLGLAISTYLQELGSQVVVVDVDSEALASVSKTFDCHLLNVTDPDNVKVVVKEVIKKYARIDVLVNNAGVIFSEPMVNIMSPSNIMHDYSRFRDSIVVNMDSVFIMTSAVVEQMVMSRGKGIIINISSISACGNEGQTAYSAAKAGVNAMTISWSKELARLGIRCNAVAPGFISTDSTQAALNENILTHIKNSTPLRRLGETQEVAQAVGSLITNDFMNGVILNVNGGLTI